MYASFVVASECDLRQVYDQYGLYTVHALGAWARVCVCELAVRGQRSLGANDRLFLFI